MFDKTRFRSLSKQSRRRDDLINAVISSVVMGCGEESSLFEFYKLMLLIKRCFKKLINFEDYLLIHKNRFLKLNSMHLSASEYDYYNYSRTNI